MRSTPPEGQGFHAQGSTFRHLVEEHEQAMIDEPEIPIEPCPYYGAIWFAVMVSCLGVWVLIGWSALL